MPPRAVADELLIRHVPEEQPFFPGGFHADRAVEVMCESGCLVVELSFFSADE